MDETSKKLSPMGDLDALKESIRCMKDENGDEPTSSVDIIGSNGGNTAGIGSGCPIESTSNIYDDDQFLGPEARGRCYTWPVAATQQSLHFPPSRGTEDSVPSLTASTNGSCTSLAYSQHALASQQLQPSDQSLKFLTLLPNSIANTAVGGSMLISPSYSNSQTDCIGAPLNYTYLRSLCSSSPVFPSCDRIPSPCQLRPLQPHPGYFGSEASCSFMRQPLLNADRGSQNLSTGMDSGYDFRNDISSQNDLSASSTVLNSTDSNLDLTTTAKVRKRGRKSDASIASGSSIAATGSSSSVTSSTAFASSSLVSQKKPNAWGSDSYAELIEKAIMSSPGGRLKLNEIYDWFIDNIPYFCKRSSQDGAVGWKNSIRHNLSLHSRFMRIQNEGAGKSSWWVINPEAKPGRNPRRRAATLEAATKAVIDKKRRGVKKRLEMGLRGSGPLHGSTGMGSQPILSEGMYESFGDDEMAQLGPSGSNFDSFRPRTQSILSIPGSSARHSPTQQQEPPGFENFDFPPYRDATAINGIGGNTTGVINGSVNEILDRTDQMRLDNDFARPPLQGVPSNGVKMESQLQQTPQQPQQSAFLTQQQQQQQQSQPQPSQLQPQQQKIKTETMDLVVKQEQMNVVSQPPSYHELNVVRAPSQLERNPLLRAQLQQTQVLASTAQPKLHNSSTGVNYYDETFNTSVPMHGQFGDVASRHWQFSGQNALHHPTTSTGGSFLPQHQTPPWSQPKNLMINSCGISTQGSLGGNSFPITGDGGANYVNCGTLPNDLQNIHCVAMDLDMDAVLLHEQQCGDNMSFDLP